MKTYKLTLLGIVALFATGCSSEADEGQNKPKSRMEMTAEEESISEAEIENAFAVFEDMATTVAPYQDNIVYSPLSKDLCLGMVANALVDGDRDRIVGKMGASSATALNEFNKNRLYYFSYNAEKAKVFFANSIWANSRWMTSEQQFGAASGIIKQYYDAECRILDFGNTDIRAQINKWCSEKTNGLIGNIENTQPTDENTQSIIINTMYFDCAWAQPFTKGSATESTFYEADGIHPRGIVKTMQDIRTLPAIWTNSFAAFSMPYADCNYSAVFVLPDRDKTIFDILPEVKEMLLTRQLDNTEPQRCTIGIPIFSVLQNNDIYKYVKKSGLDIDNCTLNGFDVDIVSTIKQAIGLTVTETGTKVVTKTEWDGTATANPGTPIVLDRPFLMIVKDNNHGSILLMAAIQMPKE